MTAMTTKVLVTDHLVPIILMSVFFMLLMPYGTFDPSQLGFYMSILCAVIIVVVTRLLIRRFRVKDKK